MIKEITEDFWEGTYIVFERQPNLRNLKTEVWSVNSTGTKLGFVKWFAQWRKYSFFPHGDVVFEEVCMTEIAQFLKTKTARHKTKASGNPYGL